MARFSILIALAALSGASLGACARPVAPVLGDRSSAPPEELRDPGGSAAAAREFRVRLRFVGPTVTLDREFRPRLQPRTEYFVFASGDLSAPDLPPVPADTVPAYSQVVQVSWRATPGEPAGAGEPALVHQDPGEALSTTGPLPQTFAPGTHLIQLRAPVHAGGGLVTVVFQVGFPPGAWWAGPDPSRFPPSSDGDGRAVDVRDWSRFETQPAWPPDGRGYFGPDSFGFVPSQRRPVNDDFERRTFYEIFGDRIYARAEGDAVHQDSWVVLVNGGYDRDSPYEPAVDPNDPALPPGFESSPDLYPLLIDQGLIGSPIAFRSNVVTRLANGQWLFPPFTTSYPYFDPNSVFRYPFVVRYWRASLPGKAYAMVVAEDAHRQQMPMYHGQAVAITDLVDAGGGTAADRQIRRHVLTFHVRPTAVSDAARDPEPAPGSGGLRSRR